MTNEPSTEAKQQLVSHAYLAGHDAGWNCALEVVMVKVEEVRDSDPVKYDVLFEAVKIIHDLKPTHLPS